MTELVPLDNLVADLRAAMEEGKSGAFFITTEDRHSAMITLDEGAITGLKYRSARGYDAARALAASPHVKYQSAADPTELPGETALESRRVLEILATAAAASTAPGQDADPAADAGPRRPRRSISTRCAHATSPRSARSRRPCSTRRSMSSAAGSRARRASRR
ncbi:MAG: hypothetical protein U5K43_15755 [Halofilum sp. (in: g-proteobacteria)]|nr:hypothetical protein [Halofilum sp. (in: g-proteobacteria)]